MCHLTGEVEALPPLNRWGKLAQSSLTNKTGRRCYCGAPFGGEINPKILYFLLFSLLERSTIRFPQETIAQLFGGMLRTITALRLPAG